MGLAAPNLILAEKRKEKEWGKAHDQRDFSYERELVSLGPHQGTRDGQIAWVPHFPMCQGNVSGQFLQWYGLFILVTFGSRGLALHAGLLLNNTEARRKCNKKVGNVKHIVRSGHTHPHGHTTHDFAASSVTVNTVAISIIIN